MLHVSISISECIEKEKKEELRNRVRYRITINKDHNKVGMQKKEKKTERYKYICIIPINDKLHKQSPNHISALTYDFRLTIHLYHYHKLQQYQVMMFHHNHR